MEMLIIMIFIIDFDGYYIVKTGEAQPRPKYIFNKCGTNIYFFLHYRGLVHHHHQIFKGVNNFDKPAWFSM